MKGTAMKTVMVKSTGGSDIKLKVYKTGQRLILTGRDHDVYGLTLADSGFLIAEFLTLADARAVFPAMDAIPSEVYNQAMQEQRTLGITDQAKKHGMAKIFRTLVTTCRASGVACIRLSAIAENVAKYDRLQRSPK